MHCLTQKDVNYQNNTGIGNIPENYKLYQNFPQTFWKVTRISFDVPVESKVKVIVYDVFGREVNHLLNKELLAGSYEIKWNASNLNAGVYYYKIYAEDFVDSKKLFLLKN